MSLIKTLFIFALLLILSSVSAQETDNFEKITVDNVSDLQLSAVVGRGSITDIDWSPDHLTLAVSGFGLWLYNPFDLAQTPKQLDQHLLSSVAYSNDGAYLATGGFTFASQFGDLYGDNILKVWDLKTGKIHLETNASIVSMLFFPDQSLLLTLNNTGGLELWDIETNERIIYSEYLIPSGTSVGYGDIVLSISPDGKYFSAGSSYPDNETYIWATQTVMSQKKLTLDTVETSIPPSNTWQKTLVSFDAIPSPDGKLLASVTQNYEKLTIIDATTQEIISTLVAHTGKSFYFYDDQVRIWEANNIGLRNTLLPGEHIDARLLYSPDGKLLASGTSYYGHKIVIWDTSTGTKSTTYNLQNEDENIVPLAFTSDNHYLFVGAFGNNMLPNLLTAIDLISNEIVAQVATEKGIVSIATSPDNLSLAIYFRDNTPGSGASEIQVWNLDKLQSEVRVHKSWQFDFQLNKIGYVTNQLLIFEHEIENQGKAISIFDIETGNETSIGDREGAVSNSFYSPALNPDRTLLAFATPTDIRFWNLNTMREIKRIDTDHTVYISFSYDGKALLSVHDTKLNSEIRLWRVPSPPD